MQKLSLGGIGLTFVLTILFVVLKLAGVIDWLWAWVLSPLWIGGTIVPATLVFIFGSMMYDDWKRRGF